jgi:hypothetical protein
MTSSSHPSEPPPSDSAAAAPATTTDRPYTGWTDLRPRAWNLLLLVPLVVCLPPLFNAAEPGLGGFPFFYWFQLAIIPVGIACTVTVHLMTRGSGEEGSTEEST